METVAEIIKNMGSGHGWEVTRTGPEPVTPSQVSTLPGNTPPGETTIRASEAKARGYQVRTEAPAPVKCEFCGRELEYIGMVSPFAPGEIFFWSPTPERCTCQQAVEYWKEADRQAQAQKVQGERRKQMQAMEARMDRLVKKSGMRGRFQARTFERWKVTPENRRAFETCRKYASSFELMLPTRNGSRVTPPKVERNGIFMVGGYGTGKTHLAAAVANSLINAGTPVICMTMIDMLARIKETFDRDTGASEAEVMRLYTEVPLLVIDDLGSEQPTEWGSTTIFSIINARYEGYMPTIVTSNCGADELVERMTPAGASDRNAQKTVDRLREMCVGLQMDWPSWRQK